jgi:hypothetical protein
MDITKQEQVENSNSLSIFYYFNELKSQYEQIKNIFCLIGLLMHDYVIKIKAKETLNKVSFAILSKVFYYVRNVITH